MHVLLCVFHLSKTSGNWWLLQHRSHWMLLSIEFGGRAHATRSENTSQNDSNDCTSTSSWMCVSIYISICQWNDVSAHGRKPNGLFIHHFDPGYRVCTGSVLIPTFEPYVDGFKSGLSQYFMGSEIQVSYHLAAARHITYFFFVIYMYNINILLYIINILDWLKWSR